MRQGSFVRKGAAPAADPGTRPGLHGQTLVSTGHPDLDRQLGGGLPLGSLLLLLEDGWSGHGTTLLRYFLAEGAACGQSLLLAAAPAPTGGLAKFVPAQLKGTASEQDEVEGGKEREDFKLRIAWQYRRYIQGGSRVATQPPPTPGRSGGGRSRASGGGAQGPAASPAGGSISSSSSGGGGAARKAGSWRDWCHRFDLLRPASDEGLAGCRAELLDCDSGSTAPGDAAASCSTRRLLSGAAAFVQSLAQQQQQQQQQPTAQHAQFGASQAVAPPRGPQLVGRLAVLSLGSAGWQLGDEDPGADAGGGSGAAGTAVVRALLRLKGLVRGARCAAVVSVPAALFGEADLARMQHLADGVIALESVADDSDIARLAPDPASVAGLLHLRKLPALGAAAPPLPEVPLHLVRHRRRRLAITPVEIDPEAELAEAEAASGAGRSVAAALCGGPPAAAKAVDF